MENSLQQLHLYFKHKLCKLAEELHSSPLCTKSDSVVVPVDSKSLLEDLLSECEKCPYTSHLSLLDPHAWRLRWLTTSILIKLWLSDNSVLALEADTLKTEAEFKHILSELCKTSSSTDVFEDLTQLYSQVTGARKVRSPAQELSTVVHSFLLDALIAHPIATNSVVRGLLCLWCSTFQGTDDELQGIYKEVLWLCVQNLESERENIQTTVNLTNTLLCLISVIQISAERENSLLEWLCPRLVCLFELGILDKQVVYFALVSRESSNWLHKLNNYEDEHYERCEDYRDLDAANLKTVCSRLFDTEGALQVEEVYRRSSGARKHFLEDILDLCSKLAINNDCRDTVCMLLTIPLLRCLWPIAVLHVWHHFSYNKDIFSVLTWMIQESKVLNDPTIERMFKKLHFSIGVVEWCKRNSSGSLIGNNELLQLANSHSILEVIRQCTNLTAEDKWLSIKEVLRCNVQSVNGDKSSIEQWTTATFDGFCILAATFKAILAGMELQTLGKRLNKQRSYTLAKLNSIELLCFNYCPPEIVDNSLMKTETSDIHKFKVAYFESVTKRLDFAKSLICNLFPLHFRIEILENLFSLIFLRHEDIEEGDLSDSCGEDDEREFDVKSPDHGQTVETGQHSVASTSGAPNLNTFWDETRKSGFPPGDQSLGGLLSPPITVPNVPSTSVPRDDDLNLNWSWPRQKTKNLSSLHVSSLPTDLIYASESTHAGHTAPLTAVPDITLTPLRPAMNRHFSLDSPRSVPTSEIKTPSNSSTRASSRKISANTSGRSRAGSTLTDVSFICNEFLVRDVLSCLKDCLVETSAAYYSSLSNSQNKTYSEPEVIASIRPESMQERLKRLSQSVSEATWRLQLITNDYFTQNNGKFSPQEPSLVDFEPDTNWLYKDDGSESESDEESLAVKSKELPSTKNTFQKHVKRNKSDGEKSSESGSHSNATGGGSVSGSSLRQLRRSKSHMKQSPLLLTSTTTINLMLSPLPSVVVQCLARGDLIKAQQVIQMPGMEDNNLAIEVKFTAAYKVLQHTMREKVETKYTEVSTTGRVGSSTLMAIKIAAMAGVQSTLYSSLVETFLSVTALPDIVGAITVKKDVPQAAVLLRGVENSEAMVSVDLALTVGVNNENSASLLDVATKYSSLLQPVSSPKMYPKFGKQSRQPLGYVQFTCSMINLLQEVNRNRDFMLNVFPQNVSLNLIITSEQFSLNHRVFEDEILYWSALQSLSKEFELALSKDEQSASKDKEMITETKDIRDKLPHLIFKKLLQLLCANNINKDFPPNKCSQLVQRLNYLQELDTHLHLLSYLLIQNVPINRGFSSPSTYFDVLEENIVSHIDHLVFKCDVLPTQLEPVTQRMMVDLVYDIVCNCCPKILVRNQEKGQDGALWGRFILNKRLKDKAGPVQHPSTAVQTLLADILEVLHEERSDNASNCLLNDEHAISLLSNPTLERIFEATQELDQIDLNLLSAGNETLVFYSNLTNLMWLHGLLQLEVTLKVFRERQIQRRDIANFGLLSPNPVQRYVAQKTIGYNIGQLGFVSLFDLQRHVLGEKICSLSCHASNMFAPEASCSMISSSSHHDPRLLFAMTNGQKGSPKVQILFSDNIDMQLDKIMSEYLNFSVYSSGNCLMIPEQLGWFAAQGSTAETQESESSEEANDAELSHVVENNEISNSGNKSTANVLRNYLNGNYLADLNFSQHLKDDITVVVKEIMPEFGITLEYTHEDQRNSSISDEGCKEAKNTWIDHIVQDHVIKFLESHCWLLSLIVSKIQRSKSHPTSEHHVDSRIQCFEHLISLPSASVLMPVHCNNRVVSALHYMPESRHLWAQLEILIGERKWEMCLELFRAIPEEMMCANSKFQALNDLIMQNLASKLPTEDSPSPWVYCQHIGNIELACAVVLANLSCWSASGCKMALLNLLDDSRALLAGETITKLQCQLKEIEIYDQISTKCLSLSGKSWYDVSLISDNNPGQILNYLIEAKELQLILEWTGLHHITTRLQQLVSAPLLLLLLDTEPPDFTSVSRFLHSVLTVKAVTICEDLINQLRGIATLSFVVNYVLSSCSSVLTTEDLLHYRHLLIGIRILEVLPPHEQLQYLELIEQPHLIVEQFVMNTRLDILEKMLDNVQSILSQLPIVSPVSVHSIDLLLRQYAAKALDFRVIQAQPTSQALSTEDKSLLSQSMASTSSGEFVMPVIIPTKDQWVPNNEVTQCMCCNAVSFSMFSRRHHCRRCGRVVCSACTRRRIQVTGYGDVLVRVCDSCYELHHLDQSLGDSSKEQTISLQGSLNSATRDSPWTLTLDSLHNSTVREEFGYEHAPSVSLCLAILKMHSEQTAYPRFLLDSCEGMLSLLQPIRPGMLNREVDHSLIIRMVRALIIAAKVKYGRSGLNTGVAHCDQLLSQADLLSELVRSDCSHLITGEALTGHALRRLRDRLVEEELWPLALDVSTKGGLERTGVWAAWGKTSLKSGQWADARQKFSHCLEKITDKGPRPLRNSPLLLEIVHILESGTYVMDRKVGAKADKSRTSHESKLSINASPALAILHRLSSLNDIAESKYPQASSPSSMVIIGPKLDPLFYDECCHYLKTYGSNAGILAFYLRHDDVAATLKHVLSQNVEPIVFYDHVYMPCLRRGAITNLHQALEAIDPTLASWKTYLCHTCSQLERFGFFNVLYQLQLFMKDLVRASMTCIRFYRSGARSYTDLAANLDYLYKARSHLQAEHATHWESSGRRSSTSSSTSLLPMKLDARDVDRHISTISHQIEVTKFLVGSQHELETSDLVATLFGTNAERLQVAVLVILSGKNVEEGFGTAFRIIQDYRLEASQVYRLAGKKLAFDNRLTDVQQLIRCIQTSGAGDTSETCDEVLLMCIRLRWQQSNPGNIELLIKMISDVGNKISAYIDCHQLKSAYLLAVKFDRLGDVKRIYNEAERLGQSGILKICAKKLSQQT